MAAALFRSGLTLARKMGVVDRRGMLFGMKGGVAGGNEVRMKERRRGERQENRRSGHEESNPAHGGHYKEFLRPGQTGRPGDAAVLKTCGRAFQ